MNYIVTNKQYNLLLESSEEELLRVPELSYFADDWNILQRYLKSKGNPRYYIDSDLKLEFSKIRTFGKLVKIKGDLFLFYSKVKSFGDLEYIGGSFTLYESQIQSLGKILKIESFLSLIKSSITTLGDLKYVGGGLILYNSKIESLGNLEYVGGHLYLGNTPLSKTTTEDEIRSKVNVVGDIYFNVLNT